MMSDQEMNAAILATAGRYLGVKEFPGAPSNAEIEAFWAAAGMPKHTDDIPWCAAYANGVLGELGIPGTGRPNARSFLDWGRKVAMNEAAPGDVVILSRGDPKGWQGHVGFLVKFHGAAVRLRGGNQADKVSDADFDVGRILGIRRADLSLPVTGYPTIRHGARGSAVMILQQKLAALRYHSGRIDGEFGPITRGSVVAFQSDNDLTADGVVGPKTWGKLEVAQPRPERAVTEQELRQRGSQTIAKADRSAGAGVVVAAGGATSIAVDIATADNTIAALERAQGLWRRIGELAADNVFPLILIGVGAFIIWQNRGIIRERVRSAVTGENVRL